MLTAWCCVFSAGPGAQQEGLLWLRFPHCLPRGPRPPGPHVGFLQYRGQAGVPHQVRHCGHGYGCPTGPAKLQQHRRGLHCVPVLVLDTQGARPQLLPWLGAPHPSVHPARPQGEQGPSRRGGGTEGLALLSDPSPISGGLRSTSSALPGRPNLPTICPWGSAPILKDYLLDRCSGTAKSLGLGPLALACSI